MGILPLQFAVTFQARLRLDTPREADYYRHGGIMPVVLRGLLAGPSS
ncbi:hypothetical protein [Nonomuraea sp. B19D2]